MNRPEFSNKRKSGFFMSKNNFYAALRTVSRYARKACNRIFRGEVVFLKKIEDFFQKNDFAPIDFFQGRFLSVAKKSP